MTRKAKQVRADMAQDLIDNYMRDLSEDHAFTVLETMKAHFGWDNIVVNKSSEEVVV